MGLTGDAGCDAGLLIFGSTYVVAILLLPAEEAASVIEIGLVSACLAATAFLGCVFLCETPGGGGVVLPEPVLLDATQVVWTMSTVGAAARTAEDCVICFTECPTLLWSTTPCGHGFHTECLNRWFQKQVGVMGCVATCPLCRAPQPSKLPLCVSVA